MVPRHDIAPDHCCCRNASADQSRAVAHRHGRNGQARLADRADTAWPDRHDDDGPRTDRAPRRARHCRRRSRAHGSFRRIRAGHGAGLRGRAAGRASIRRTQAASGAPLAAGRTVGGRHHRPPGQYRAALGRRAARGRRAVVRDGGDGRALPGRIDVVDDPCLVLHRLSQLHGVAQPSRAGIGDHHRGHPRQWLARLRLDPRRSRPAATSIFSAPGSRPRS